MIDPNEIYKASDIAKIFSVSGSQVRVWVAEGKVPGAFTTPGGHIRIKGSDLIKFIESCKV